MTKEELLKKIDFEKNWLYECGIFGSDVDIAFHAIKKSVIEALEQEPKTGHCKDCKYFEYDSVANVGGIPLIVAHEICNKWGDGCKTSEEGFCFLFEPKESEE